MKDMHSSLKAQTIFGPVALSADNTPAALDLRGYDAAEIILGVGVGGITFSGTNKIEFKLTHSDDDSTYAAVETADMLGVAVASGGIIKSLIADHPAAAVYRFGYKGGKRYLKLLADFSGTHGTATPLSATLLLRHGHDNPQANQA
ncbi:hypothetical protein [Xanthobacter flavus]|uniref:hypothetical protein n=1 Tax=Xanthobacter flavus TaxID=281 RepID=UPI003729D79E